MKHSSFGSHSLSSLPEMRCVLGFTASVRSTRPLGLPVSGIYFMVLCHLKPLKYVRTWLRLLYWIEKLIRTIFTFCFFFQRLRSEPAIYRFKRRIGHAPIKFSNLDSIFWHGAVHALTDAVSVGRLFFFSSRDMAAPTPENYKSDRNYRYYKKTKRKHTADTECFLNVQFKYGAKPSVYCFSKFSAASLKCHCFS